MEVIKQKSKIAHCFFVLESGNKGFGITSLYSRSIFATVGGRVVYTEIVLSSDGHLAIMDYNNDYLSVYTHIDRMLV